ncbi:helix-turn-helix domain-containing protein [Brevundimonas variabilis]|uniref:helix-turn-helix domain-containing protein n=1 Tax=Brevundimonas variabilis TaxID=74312 RepID=UPI0016058D52|nr:helix-turn-helix transcriptional regulator [Brevundimonas variabilis]
MDWKAHVGRNILKFRNVQGWSQQTLANEANLSIRFVAGVERGEENPSLETLIAIADALQVKPAQLLD